MAGNYEIGNGGYKTGENGTVSHDFWIDYMPVETPFIPAIKHIGTRSPLTAKQQAHRKTKNQKQRNSRKVNRGRK